MNLTGLMPFSFVDPSQYDARSCDNGPFVTQTASATFLNSDPCYDPASSKPGAYSPACLQQLFLGMGGTAAGSGYPSDASAALQLNLTPTGTPRSLTDIGAFLTSLAVQTATGMNNGQELSLPAWSAASVFLTGKVITSPCDNSPANGPLSAECLTYLYTNGGATDKTIGPTYSLGPSYTSQDACGNAVYCTPSGTLNPATPTGLAAATGGIAAVQALYDTAHKTANDNTLTNEQRRPFLQQCYGIQLQHANPEAFWVGGPNQSYTVSSDQATATCASLGAVVATDAQLINAQINGASWCAAGWVADSTSSQTPPPITTAQYPMTTTVAGCGAIGINDFGSPAVAGVTCYGPKPAPSSFPTGLMSVPFNQSTNVWNAPFSE